jgi:hypothetical protein
MSVRIGFPRICVPLLLVAGAGARAQEMDVREVPLPIDSLLSSNVVIARVGPTAITVREFVLTSLFGPAFVKRAPDTRRRTLNYMINEKLLALGVRRSDPSVAENLEALEGDLATEELYRDDVLSHVRVPEHEIANAVRQWNTEVSLRWLFRTDRNDAAEISRAIRAGVPFDTLFAREIADSSVNADDREMTATLFKVRQHNAAMAALAESLPVRRPSDPVEGPDGYYILQIDSLSRQVLSTETAEVQARSDVRRALTKMKADSLSDSYVRRRMLEADPVILRPAFDLLRAHLGSLILKPEKFGEFELTRDLAGGKDYRNIDRYGSETLVKLARGNVTLRDFLQWYRLREVNIKITTSSPQALFLSLQDVVWRMVRDRLLIHAARQRGLQRRPDVITQKRWWKEKLLFQVAKDSIMRTIAWTDSTLRAYYNARSRSFRDSSGNTLPFESVKDDVLREWYDLELKKRVFHTLNRLKKEYRVTVDEKVLQEIPVDAENDPRAIEVYTVKKGGTFPHQAFPTIDYFWQTWQ